MLGFSEGKMDMTSTQLGITCTNEKLFKYSVIFRCKIITMMCVSTKNHLKCSNLGWLRLCLGLDWPKKQLVLQNRSRNPSLKPFRPSSSVQQNSPWQNSSLGLQNSSPEFQNIPFVFNVKGAILQQFRGVILQSRGSILRGGYFCCTELDGLNGWT